MRCVKARIASWLNSDKVGATVPVGEGQFVLLAVYDNGKYVKPEVLNVPDSPATLGWGPDGPLNMGQPPQSPPEEGGEQEDPSEDDQPG